MDPLSNPYRPGAGTAPPALIGRDDLLDHFGTTVRRALAGRPGKGLMPIGLRGVGKTVLLNRCCEIAEAEGFLVAYIESPETGDLPSMLAIRLRKVLLEMERSGPAHAVLRALRVLKTFTLQLPDGARVQLDVDALAGEADSGSLPDDLTDLLVAVGQAARDRGTGVLLAIDELQYLDDRELGALITAVHRTVQLDLPVVLVGAALPQLPALAGEAKSYAERLLEFPRIDSLDPEDAAAALVIPASQQGVRYEKGALALIVDRAHGYPYFLQEWGYHVWNGARGKVITRREVERLEPEVIARLDENFFRVRFDRLTPRERDYLRAMAQLGPGPHRSGDVAAVLGVKVESLGPRRSALIGKGMLYSPAHGDTAFTVPLFDEFLRRTMPDWSP